MNSTQVANTVPVLRLQFNNIGKANNLKTDYLKTTSLRPALFINHIPSVKKKKRKDIWDFEAVHIYSLRKKT